MIQHARRKIESFLPVTHEISIPISTVLQNGVASVTTLTLRFGTALTAGVTAGAAVWPEPIPARLVIAVLAAAAWDRSGLTYVRVRRTE
ncbi:hypothetical protein [Streptomyces ziwulingensis]|uniref:Uncharacterized protein n=1 Tax=Streptomyces ziwulingensis TaxID=1045501 RepID=A0ABP9AJ11_9ACTN